MGTFLALEGKVEAKRRRKLLNANENRTTKRKSSNNVEKIAYDRQRDAHQEEEKRSRLGGTARA